MNKINMYELPPVYGQKSENKIVLPKNMYKMPEIYEKSVIQTNTNSINGQISGSLDQPKSGTNLLISIEDFRDNELASHPLNDLISRQQLLLSRIKDLEKEINARLHLKSGDNNSKQINDSKRENKVQKDSKNRVLIDSSVGLKDEVLKTVKDIVIFTNTKQIPISVFAVINLMKNLGLKVMLNVHNHSSLDIKANTGSHLNQLNAILSSINLNYKNNTANNRLDHDFIVTIIFKDITENEMILSPKDLSPIRGEANILRFMARIAAKLKPELGYLYEGITDISRLTLVDNFVDEIHENLFVNSSVDTKFDSSLSSKKYLTGDNLTIADLLLWSGLNQKPSKPKLSPALEKMVH